MKPSPLRFSEHQLPSQYLLDMPRKVLMGQARGIERWCREHQKCPPTLLDLALARKARRNERRRTR
jgi:hypothetical protein